MKPFLKTLITLGAIAGVSTIAIFIFHTNQPSIALTEEWTVTDIIDGDTLTVRQTDGSQMQVKLCGIDTPQLQHSQTPIQTFDSQAKEKLRSLVAAADNQVMVIPVEKDTDGRTVAEVMTTGKDGIEISFQEEMLKSSMAYYRKSAANCPNTLAFEKAEKLAIASQTGVWSQPRLEKPYR
ncbi:thermonuclease family protein [Nostoc sp. WHI]|nr:thermonuclease family protein [Nostoc sp. WHI]MBG1268091.1 thermonuclease family protein [Nostoc sp. WHI]